MCPAYGYFDIKGCGPVPSLDNAKEDSSKTAYGTVVTYFCKKCFKKIGDISSECQANERWTPILGSCVCMKAYFSNIKLIFIYITISLYMVLDRREQNLF